MFNVGDRVVGNHYARGVYSITKEGWVGTVVEVIGDGRYITVQDDDGDKFEVEAYRFDLVECITVDELESAKIDEFFSEFQ